jgi:Flp pilus assembly protein TadD
VLVALGQIEWQRGQTDAARSHFELASEDPQEYEAPCQLGRLWLSLGDPTHAVEALTRALERNASDAEAREAMAKALLALGRGNDALAQVQTWKKDAPKDAEADRTLALVELRLGQLDAADGASAHAVRRLPREVEAHRVRAAVLFAKGQTKGGIAELQRANKLDPKDPVTFCDIGRAFLREGKADVAEKAYLAAQKLSPELACAAVGLIDVRLPGEAKVAIRALNELSQRAKDSWDRANAEATLARAYIAAGNTREATRRAALAVQLAPTLADGYWAQGLIALRSRDVPAARTALARAAALDPGYAAIRLANADALARGDDALEQAIPEYQAYLRLSTKSPDQARVKKLIPTLKKRLASR